MITRLIVWWRRLRSILSRDAGRSWIRRRTVKCWRSTSWTAASSARPWGTSLPVSMRRKRHAARPSRRRSTSKPAAYIPREATCVSRSHVLCCFSKHMWLLSTVDTPSPIPVERTTHGAKRFGDTPRAGTLHMAHRLYRLHRVMHSTRYHSPRNNQHGKGKGALHRPLRLPRQQCNEVCRTSFPGG